MDKKVAIIEYLNRAKYLVYDSNTFLKVRVERPFYIGDEIGGGNLLIALGLFSAINYLAKIYVLLNGQWTPPTPKDIEEAREQFKRVDRKFREYLIFTKRRDSVNETLAFTKLLLDQNCPQNLGIDQSEYSNVYHDIRNHLTHRIAPNRGHTMMTFQSDEGDRTPYGDIKISIKNSNRHVFQKNGNVLICYVDILGRDVEKIADWLIKDVADDKFTKEGIDLTFDWLEGVLEN